MTSIQDIPDSALSAGRVRAFLARNGWAETEMRKTGSIWSHQHEPSLLVFVSSRGNGTLRPPNARSAR